MELIYSVVRDQERLADRGEKAFLTVGKPSVLVDLAPSSPGIIVSDGTGSKYCLFSVPIALTTVLSLLSVGSPHYFTISW